MKITAAVLREKSGPFHIEEVELGEIREDEVLVRIAGCGICHTDLSAREQLLPSPLPIVLGHEGSGVVEKVGVRVSKVSPGDHVVLGSMSCGGCTSCQKGKPDWCLSTFPLNFFGKRADGSLTLHKNGEPIYASFFGQSSFATHAIANERNTIKVTQQVPLELLGPLGCGVRTGAGGVIHSLGAKAGSSIAVFGTGSVGMSAILAAAACGCAKIIAVDIQPERLALAKSLGATHTLAAGQGDAAEKIRQWTGGGAEYSLDCSGVPKVIRQAVECLAVGGKCGLIGAPGPGVEVNLEVVQLLPGRTVYGIMGGDVLPDTFVPQLIELYTQGRLPFDKMIRFYPLEQINQAVADCACGLTLKAVVRP